MGGGGTGPDNAASRVNSIPYPLYSTTHASPLIQYFQGLECKFAEIVGKLVAWIFLPLKYLIVNSVQVEKIVQELGGVVFSTRDYSNLRVYKRGHANKRGAKRV